jgi:chromosome segregation ATPase
VILRSLRVENWRCIRQLELTDLPDGVVVLHGPNRTGKSSLVLALRSCLFEDHDSACKEVRTSIPWTGQGPPQVSIEFATSGAVYRLTKVFSKRKEGTALLEKQVGSGWKIEHDAPKEASRRTRELLGAEKSDAGLNQLLWLNQGDIWLPKPKDLDGSLEKQLVAVLSVMVTVRDLAFKQSLEKRYARWFTERGGKYREGSAVSQWEKQRQERLRARAEEEKKLEQWEGKIRELQECESELPSARKAVEQARIELEQLKHEREAGRERRRLHDEADKALQEATLAVAQAEESLKEYHATQRRTQEDADNLSRAQHAEKAAQEQKDARARQHEEQLRLLDQARQAEEQHRQTRADIDDRRALLALAHKRVQLDKLLQGVAKQEQEIAHLETQLRTVIAPDEKALEELRLNRRRAESLRARLSAAALTLSVTLERPAQLRLGVDDRQTQPVDLPRGEKHSWPLRQQARIELPNFGTIEVTRAEQDVDLEKAAHELERLDRAYDEGVRSFQQDPTNETCLDRLAERRLQRNTWTQRLQDVRRELQSLAPDGRGVLEAERDSIANQQRVILQRRPDLDDWQPSEFDVEEGEKRFKASALELESVRKQHEQRTKTAWENLQRAEAELTTAKLHLKGAETAAHAGREELLRIGEETALSEKRRQAQEAVEKARQALATNGLTDAEKTIEQRYRAAEAALDERNKRLREREDKLLELRSFLQGNEGLHIRLADAETRLREAETALARETLEAGAHKRLRDLFEECRDNQVQQVMGPISGRVLDWSRQLGLNDYREVRFGDRFLPESILLEGGNPEQPILFDDESYGTAEQLSLLVRLALGGVLAVEEPVVAILDDPLAHADPAKHRNMLNVLRLAAEGSAGWSPPAGRIQVLILTCHPDRFDYLPGARHINLAQVVAR